MATREQADAVIDAWLTRNLGVKRNPDGRFGVQCVDLVDAYAQDLFGVRWQDSMGGVAGAKDLMDVAPVAYWEKIPNDPENEDLLPRRGDVIVWGGNPDDYYTKWGHTAVVESATHTGVHVLQQDGFAKPLVETPDGWFSDKPAHREYLNWWNPGTGMVSGWLRPRPKKIRGQSMAKTYRHETKWTTKNQVERSFYGFGPKPTGITLHWWGNPGQKFDNVAHFLSTNDVPTSAHYVVEDGRIATLAVPEMATYHAGHTVGNGTTIGIECRPEMTAGDLDTVVQLIFELEQTYGSLNIYQHCDWFPTQCAGTWGRKVGEIIDRVNAMHSNGGRDPKLATAKPAPKLAPKPTVTPQAAKVEPVKPREKTPREINPTGYDVWAYKNRDIESRDAYQILRDLSADVATIKSKLEEK